MTRVAITTDRFARVAPGFSAVGLDPVHLPCIRVERRDEEAIRAAREAVAGAELVVVTSARTVSLLWPEGDMPLVDVAAVGRITASAVSAAGARVVATGRSGLSGLVEAASATLKGRNVVLIHASGADPNGMARLESVVGGLDEHVVYRVTPIAPDQLPVEAVVFASPTAVQGWAMSRGFDQLVVGVIGHTTAREAARHRSPDLVASTPSFPALAHELSSYLEVRV